jgi:hypothetical protein
VTLGAKTRRFLKRERVGLGSVSEDSNEGSLKQTKDISRNLVRVDIFQGASKGVLAHKRNVRMARWVLVALKAQLGGGTVRRRQKERTTWGVGVEARGEEVAAAARERWQHARWEQQRWA